MDKNEIHRKSSPQDVPSGNNGNGSGGAAGSEDLKKAVEGTANKLLQGEKNHIFVLTEKSSFNEDIMLEAIGNLEDFLIPRPTEEEKNENDDYTKFAVDDKKLEEFLQNYVLNDGVLSLELMLLVVTAVSKSSDKMKKSLFKIRKAEDSNKSAGSIIFRHWLSYAIGVMEKRRHRFSRNKPKLGEVRTEELIASAILELISNFNVIKTAKQINTLKTKYSVDWIDSIAKTNQYATVHNISGVISACKIARDRLEVIGVPLDFSTYQSINATRTISNTSSASVAKSTTSTTNEAETETKTKVQMTPEEAKRKRLAKLIEDSSKRISNQKKDEKPVSVPQNQKPSHGDENKIKKREENGLSGLPLHGNWKNDGFQRSSSGRNNSNTQKERQLSTSSDNNRLGKREEDGLSGLPMQSSWRAPPARTTSRDRGNMNDRFSKNGNKDNDNDRFSRKEEDGLSGLPMQSSWKASPAKTSNRDRGNMNDRFSKNGNNDNDRLGRKEEDGLSGLPMQSSWKAPMSQKRETDTRDTSSDDKRRKLNGSTYFVPKSKNQDSNFPNSNLMPDSNTGSVGRGRGRGKDINKPAWMTRQESNRSVTSETSRSVSSSIQNPLSNEPVSDMRGLGRGRGRGKDLNKPAWMTREESKLGSSTGSFKSPSNSMQNAQSHDQIPDNNIGGVNNSMGRGKDMNKPAWVTRQESGTGSVTGSNRNLSNNVPKTHNREHVTDNSIRDTGRGNGRGRGRGKDINKPAWMTKSVDSVGSTFDSNRSTSNNTQNSNEQVPSNGGTGRGRGRGKDLNKPAWMTRQESNNVASESSRSLSSSEPNLPNTRSISEPIHSNVSSTKQINRTVSSNTQNTHGRASGRDTGRGRGRGKDINKPAWMTKQQSNQISGFESRGSNNESQQAIDNVSSNFSHSAGRGRGRGKDINKPAWMTRQESNTSVTSQSANAMSDRNSDQPPNNRRSSWEPPQRQNSSSNEFSRRSR